MDHLINGVLKSSFTPEALRGTGVLISALVAGDLYNQAIPRDTNMEMTRPRKLCLLAHHWLMLGFDHGLHAVSDMVPEMLVILTNEHS
jgi:hypothetical protein